MNIAQMLQGGSGNIGSPPKRTIANVRLYVCVALAQNKIVAGSTALEESLFVVASAYATDPVFRSHCDSIAKKMLDLFPEPLGNSEEVGL